MYWDDKNAGLQRNVLKMVQASEQAIRILIKIQQECEELYLSGPELMVFPDREEAPEK